MYITLANAYMDAVLSGKTPACKFVKEACKRQRNDLKKKKSSAWPYTFDPKKATRPCKFIECLKHVKGPQAGQNIRLEPWQCFILTTIFGWLDDKGHRRFNHTYIEVPRGNGKSTLCSGVALYMLCADGERGADVYSFATTREQARIVFDDASEMARKNADLRAAYHATCLRNSVVILGTNSKFMPKSAEAKTLDGLNTHCGIIDELHAHPTREVYDVVNTSIGKRDQPLIFCITTAGYQLEGICMEHHRFVGHILDGSANDDSYFGIIYTIDDGDDWRSEQALIKANPNWGVSVIPKVVMSNYALALQNSAAEKNFLTKHLCVWCNADTQWLQMYRWRQCIRPDLNIDDFEGMPCIYAIDLATKIDITAIIRLFWNEEEDGRVHFYIFPLFFLPSERVENAQNSQYAGWVRDGLIQVTDGPITDLAAISRYISNDFPKYDTLQIAYDPYQATQMAQELASYGAPMLEIGATVFNFSEPMKQLQALVYDKRIHTDGNPVLEWMASNTVAHLDAKENIFPRKEKPENKIDGIVALIMAMNVAIKRKVETDYLPGNSIPYTELFL